MKQNKSNTIHSRSPTAERILAIAAERFAQQGFDAISMRDIAQACEMKAPSLYNHFKDKQALYEGVLKFVFFEQGQALSACVQQPGTHEEKIRRFISLACQQMASNTTFRQLFIRELLGQDSKRLQFLAQEVMAESCVALHDLFLELNPTCDPHFLTTTLMGLVFFHFQSNALRVYLPGNHAQAQSATYLAEHISRLILCPLRKC